MNYVTIEDYKECKFNREQTIIDTIHHNFLESKVKENT